MCGVEVVFKRQHIYVDMAFGATFVKSLGSGLSLSEARHGASARLGRGPAASFGGFAGRLDGGELRGS